MSLYDINGNIIPTGSGGTSDLSSLNGKVWLALGDSYTSAFAGAYTDGVTPSTEGIWWSLANTLGMTLYSYGIASSTIRYSTNNGTDGYSYQPMVTRVDGMIADHESEAENVGLITFMGGGNDSWAEEFLGDLKSTQNTTICGSCHQIFNKLSNAFPNAKIVVILQPVTANGTTPTDSEFNELDDIQYSIYQGQLKQKIVKEAAEFYGLPICDGCFEWYTPANPTSLSTIWQSDKMHLTYYGRQELNKKFIATLEKALV